MKRSITLLLALLLLLSFTIGVANAAPPANSAARQAQLSAIRPNEIPQYETKLPTNGTKATEKEYKALLAKYPNKDKSKGDTAFTYELIIDRKYADGHNIVKAKTWEKAGTKNTFPALYSERVYFDTGILLYEAEISAWGALIERFGRNFSTKDTLCYLETEDKSHRYRYYWVKGSKVGMFEKWGKYEENEDEDSSSSEYIFYKDETVLGELCKVYSISGGEDWDGDDRPDGIYYWLSTVTGKIIKTSDSWYRGYNYNLPTDGIRTFFIDYRLNKPASFYTPPKDVKFTEFIGG